VTELVYTRQTKQNGRSYNLQLREQTLYLLM